MAKLLKLPLMPFPQSVEANHFAAPSWSDLAGEKGGYVARSHDGQFEAVAEPIEKGFRFWIVRVEDGSTILAEDILHA
jgi:hypothetical protein